jgi:hypothetical protein
MDTTQPTLTNSFLKNTVNNYLIIVFADSSLDVDSMSFEQVQEIVKLFKNQQEPFVLTSEWADLSEFDKQFKNVDNSKLIVRETESTKKVPTTEISSKEATIQVTQCDVKKGGVFSREFVMFQVETEIPGRSFKNLV